MIDEVTDNILISSGALEKERKYWSNKLSEYVEQSNIFNVNKNVQALQNKQKKFQFNDNISNEINIIANRNPYGVYMILLSGVYYIVYRYTGYTDITIGTPVFKQEESLEKLINYILPLRSKINDDMSFKEYILSIQKIVTEANQNMNYPYEKMLKIVNKDYNVIDNKLFDIFVKFNGIHNNKVELGNSCNFTLAFDYIEDNISCNLKYNSQLISEERANSIIECYLNYFETVLKNGDVKLKDIEILPLCEKNKIFNEFNNTNVSYPKEKTLDQLVEEQTRRKADSVALIFDDKEMTYGELNYRINQLANLLKSEKIKNGDIVAIIMPRSLEQIVGVLAILKINAICLPIDISNPKERIRYILKDSGAKVILKGSNTKLSIQGTFKTLNVNKNTLDMYSKNFVSEKKSSENIAYIIYTSGSTGKPKGVLLRHYGIINHIYTKIKELKIQNNDALCFNLNINFVATIWQIFTPLILGLKLYIYNEEIIRDPYKLITRVEKDKANVVEIVPAMLNIYLDIIETEKEKIELKNLRCIVLTGEKVQANLVRRMFNNYGDLIELVNAYGQSECSDDTLHYHIPYNKYVEKVPIGRPSNNTKVFVMNRARVLQPIGAIGELYISGYGVSAGYLNHKELDNDAFMENPYLQGEIMYKTGDQGRWLSDGNVEYIGRNDQQVKIRGNKVELNEIEIQLLKYNSIKEAVVTVIQNQQQINYLCAYIVTKSDVNVDDVRNFLKNNLPSYMIPHFIVKLEKFPLTPNGKISRNDLPDPRKNLCNKNNYEPPRNNVENMLVNIWQEVLDIKLVGINDNFFNLGGDSLKAIRVISNVEKSGYDIQYNTLITYPTIKELASIMNERFGSKCSEQNSLMENVEEIVEEKFGILSQLVEYTVQGNEYNVLYLCAKEETYLKKEVIKIIAQKCSDIIWPHYIVFVKNNFNKKNYRQMVNEDEFYKIINLEKGNCKSNISSILNELDVKENKFVHEISDQEVIDTFPCSAIQEGTASLLNGHLTGIILPIELLVDENLIIEGLKNIIFNQQLLRCAVYKENNKLMWKEFKRTKEISIPFIDISRFDYKTRDEIIRHIVKTKYFNLYFEFGVIHYRFILIKESLRCYKLIAPIDHILFDAMSSEIIVRSLREYISGHKLKKSIHTLNYKDYTRQLLKGPMNISTHEFIKLFNLKEYRLYADDIEKFIVNKVGENEACSLEFKINLKDLSLVEDKIWEISFFLTVLICKSVFNVKKVPLKLFYYGRNYEDKNYYDIVGYFIDFIPLLIDVDENDINSNVRQVKKIIKVVKEHNVNFLTLAMSKEIGEKWGNIYENYKSKQLSILGKDQMIMYNFQGKRESYGKVKSYYDLGKTYFEKYRLEGSSFNIVSYYTDKYLCLSILSKFKFDKKKIEKEIKYKLKQIIEKNVK
ncbi:amino acid adenylation domain-containing protein [Clostridium felsineum]|uniref:amino acid adenylation domain-containing protein n=1 Tax=Clostridium felsineum TaxID=36839 RepID=UPI00214D1FC5|nr:amino acid adenylation domain-containing protein [Clostridium felsineum]MCR3758487.1 amino acid adenylation domain-containing protein [Clostridium felsineum]